MSTRAIVLKILSPEYLILRNCVSGNLTKAIMGEMTTSPAAMISAIRCDSPEGMIKRPCHESLNLIEKDEFRGHIHDKELQISRRAVILASLNSDVKVRSQITAEMRYIQEYPPVRK
jgi:hypothetical protein